MIENICSIIKLVGMILGVWVYRYIYIYLDITILNIFDAIDVIDYVM